MIEEIKIRPEDEFIKLGQLLKKAGVASVGTEAKALIEEGQIMVNGEVEYRRGRKIKNNDVVSGEGWSYRVVQ